jgi:hypothetical protein
MKVIVYCASEGSQSDVSGLTLKCTPSERRVWVENGKGAGGRKIAFSSTFDGVVDGSTAEGAAQALYDEGFAKAVEAVTADKVGCVLCVGSGAGKRGALLGAACELALAKLLQAADEKGLELSIAAVHVLWVGLSDLLDGAAIEPGTTATGAGGDGTAQSASMLFGAVQRPLTSAAAATAALRDIEEAAAAAEAAAMGAAGGGHLAVQLTLGEGKLLLVDASDVSFAEASSSLLSSTLCHHSHAMLLKCLAKPSARPTVADTALLPRLLAPAFFDAGASARLVLHVPPSASPTIVDMLRSAQAAAKAAKSKKQSDSDRSGAVIELLQGRLAEPKPPPSAEQVVSSLRAIMGDTAAVGPLRRRLMRA